MEAAFFDMDKTVIARAGSLALGKDFYRQGLISKRTLARGLAAQIVYLMVGADDKKMERMREHVLALAMGWEKAKVEQIVEEVMGEAITPIIYQEALELMEQHRAAGRKVFIVSSSPVEIAAPIGRMIGADDVLASRAVVDDEGRYTGELDFYCYGELKVRAMEELVAAEGIDLGRSYAYSDSVTDLPMLEAVGHPVATNPDRELRRIAHERGWETVSFTRPFTLRKRLAEIRPSPRATVVSGGIAASVAAGVATYLWFRRRAVRNHRTRRPPVAARLLARSGS